MHIYRSAERVEIIQVAPLEGGRYEQRPPPKQLPSNQVVLLSPVGSLFFAGATEFEENLPAVEKAERPVVILILRGRDEVGSTFLQVMKRYAASLEAKRGKLILAGVSEHVYMQLEKTGLLDELGRKNVYRATRIMGDAALTALEDARTWLESSPMADQTKK
jgi:SulP family sulfate permease